VKRAKLFRMLAICVVLALLVALVPASPALAAREIELEKDEGEIGEYIDITGSNFVASDPYAEPDPIYSYVDIYFTSEVAEVGYDIDDEVNIYDLVEDKILVDAEGDFEDRFRVPTELNDGSPDEDVRGGTYYVCVTEWNEEDIKAVAEFTITAGEITGFDPDSGPVSTEVEINGENFGDSEDITIEYDGDEIDIDSGDSDTDSRGDFDCTIIIPHSIAGDHTITIKDETLTEVEETFTVEPEMSFTPLQAPPDGTVTITGTGFGDEADVEVTLGTVSVASGTTDDDGDFTISFTVPEMDEGIYDLVVEDDDGNDDEGEFTVEIGIEVSISPVTSSASPGHVGQDITVSGAGFEPNSTVTITYTSEPQVVATPESNADGVFSATFEIPASEGGAHTITASDGTNSLELAFYMERQAPEIPQPLLPEMGVKAKSKTFFDWEDVEDVSGVTYELQVATSDEFTAASMVVELVGLSESEHTLTAEEALASRSEEEPYYWRVRAVDGAGNASGWTLGEFSVGFTWPDWIIHLWWGLGVIGAIFLGYYLGKRRAYYY
jgi:hypothetical protein